MIELSPFDALALSLHHSPGDHAILVGSGLSRAAEIPTGWDITLVWSDVWRRWRSDRGGRLGEMVLRQIRQSTQLLGNPHAS